jgi:hypothetical protein
VNPEDRRTEELLGRALRSDLAEPPTDGIARVRARAEAGLSLPQARPRRRVRYVAAAAAAILLAFGVGLLVGEELPRPLRAALHDIGLPVDSPEFVETEDTLLRLGVAIAAGDTASVEKLDDQMLALVHTLDEDERARIEPAAHEVHLVAQELLAEDTEEASTHAHG